MDNVDDKSILTGLRANHFRHPLDLQATESLKQLPGLGLAIRTLLRPTVEHFFYLENIATSVLVGPDQLPDIYSLLVEACQILDIEQPQLYIKQHPIPNAYTFAMRGKQPFIVVHTALIELINAKELQSVIGHELGHLKCDHGVYLTLANLIALAASQLPLGPVLAQNLQSQIMEWVRCAEFTCDRAALLVSQDSRTVASVLMKLTGGSATLSPQLNLDAFLAQAQAYEDLSHDQLGLFLKQMRTQDLTHPVPVLRAKEVTQWHSTQDYQKLLQTRSINYNVEATGGWRNW
ncbi:M48 family metallopeptidase [Leptothoe spongobia TAU-MAC 1115]|uniref:M48 family metallopeptidase n=1 Tax=Leptothoe spongobia TAU-MAC 1115 TaxID=1967444 RepID=A0A947GEC6_9CYAN|nr:M48 family metallopeptidase [Leptothoe spongobia TAU-MAC 1115]